MVLFESPLQELMGIVEPAIFSIFSLEAAAGYMGLIDLCSLHLFKHSFGLGLGFLGDMEQPPLGGES